MLKKLLLLIALAVLLAACLPAQQQSAEFENQVNTAVAGTLQAEKQIDLAVEQTVAAKDAETTGDTTFDLDNNVLLQASATPEPTFTPFVLPTFTPTITQVPPKYSCSIVTKKPKTNEVFAGGVDFDIKWTIKNTGTATWYDAADIKYYSGTSFANSTRAEIRAPLAPGQTFDLVLDATAPKKSGYHFMAWMVEGGLCFGYVNIWVK